MMRKVGLCFLTLLLFACFVPVYSILVIFPVSFIFGAHDGLFKIELAVTYLLSAATAIWLVAKLWIPKGSKATSSNSGDSAG